MTTRTELSIDILREYITVSKSTDEDIFYNDSDRWGFSGFCILSQCEDLLGEWECTGPEWDEMMGLLLPAGDLITHKSVAELLSGEHYKTGENIHLLHEALDWAGLWPVVDAEGNLTGDVYDSGQSDATDYANVDDEAMVAIADLPEAEQRQIRQERLSGIWSGYADLP